jgi:hypothetical protein
MLGRSGKDWIIGAQVHLLWRRRELRQPNSYDFREWMDLTEAVAVLEQCLKLIKEEK